jgi:hypothetical protein
MKWMTVSHRFESEYERDQHLKCLTIVYGVVVAVETNAFHGMMTTMTTMSRVVVVVVGTVDGYHMQQVKPADHVDAVGKSESGVMMTLMLVIPSKIQWEVQQSLQRW